MDPQSGGHHCRHTDNADTCPRHQYRGKHSVRLKRGINSVLLFSYLPVSACLSYYDNRVQQKWHHPWRPPGSGGKHILLSSCGTEDKKILGITIRKRVEISVPFFLYGFPIQRGISLNCGFPENGSDRNHHMSVPPNLTRWDQFSQTVFAVNILRKILWMSACHFSEVHSRNGIVYMGRVGYLHSVPAFYVAECHILLHQI